MMERGKDGSVTGADRRRVLACFLVGVICACASPASEAAPEPPAVDGWAPPTGPAPQQPARDAPADAAQDAGSSPGSVPASTTVDAGPQRAGDAPPGGQGADLGAPELTGGDTPSSGGTITFQQIGATGWYPSRRDPELGPCDAYEQDGCCMARREVDSDRLTPWNEDLIMTLRGPMRVTQLAAYQPAGEVSDGWTRVSSWDARATADSRGVEYRGDPGTGASFDGAIGSECLVDVSTDTPFPCGAGSTPYCSGDTRNLGWSGSKLFVLLAAMPHAHWPDAPAPCSEGSDGNWYDAPWIGLSLGELVRAGAFSSCHCYARDPAQWWLGDGCGQLNAFEVVNDNNEYRNLEVFSTNFFGYAGYVGEGPCGAQCDVAQLDPAVDLIDKSSSSGALAGAVASPGMGPGAAFRRPTAGPRYFLILLDETSRTVQLALVHPERIPEAAGALLPALPAELEASAIDALLQLRLP